MKNRVGGGYSSAEIRCADVSRLLQRISAAGIVLRNCVHIDELTLHVIFQNKDSNAIGRICSRAGAELKIIDSKGVRLIIKGIASRPVVWVGILLLIWISIFLPRRVLILRVEGNLTVPTAKILEAARECGIQYGISGKSIRSEEIKNGLIRQIPRLRWVGVNVRGCVATISVTENTENAEQEKGITKIVAARDGIVTDCTVVSGNMLCAPGQAVRKGDTLVSGYSTDGIFLKGTRVSGEIYGNTVRVLNGVMPVGMREKGRVIGKNIKLVVMIGKKRLFFNNNSRISGGICDKMYKEYYISLPNGFRLPLGIGFERCVIYEDLAVVSEVTQTTALKQAARSYLLDQMISGEVRTATESVKSQDGLILISGVYFCHELIGREEMEDISQYGENN